MNFSKAILLFLVLFSTNAFSQEKNEFSYEVKGLMFGDFYYVQKHHQPESVGAVGAVMRRVYLTLDVGFGSKWFGRLRFEGNQDGGYEVYNYEVDFKDLYVGYNFGKHKITVGLSPTKTFDVIEANWKLRYLARTPMDMQGNPSRDLGISVDGVISEEIGLNYRFMFGDGQYFGAETGDGSKMQGAISWQINKEWIFDVYSDYERMEGETDRSTIQFFIGYTSEDFRFGTQYSYQDRQTDPTLELFSIYAVGKVYKNISVIGRYDRIMEPSPRGDNISYIPFDPNSRANFFIGGIEFPVGKYFTFTPNIIYINYDESDTGYQPDSDLNYRLTVFFKI